MLKQTAPLMRHSMQSALAASTLGPGKGCCSDEPGAADGPSDMARVIATLSLEHVVSTRRQRKSGMSELHPACRKRYAMDARSNELVVPGLWLQGKGGAVLPTPDATGLVRGCSATACLLAASYKRVSIARGGFAVPV